MAVIWHDINKMTSNTSLSPIVPIGINSAAAKNWRMFNDVMVKGVTDLVYLNAESHFIGIDFGNAVPLSSIKVAFDNSNDTVRRHAIIQTSNDGTAWITNKEIVFSHSDLVDIINDIPLLEVKFNYVEARFIRMVNLRYEVIATGAITIGGANTGVREVYFGYEIPTYKATIELYNANTLEKITTSVSGTLLKNGASNKSLTFTNGSLLVDNLDNTSTWSISTAQNANYNELITTNFAPGLNNPIVKLYLKPTVKKKFNFFDENRVALSGKSVKLKIYKDGSTTPLIDITVNTSTYTTTTLYEGSYTYELQCEGYRKVNGVLNYDDSELNVNFTLYTPINKTLILHDGKYKKWNEKVFGGYINMIPQMTSNTLPSGEAFSSSSYNTSRQAWKAFNGTNVNAGDNWNSTYADGNSGKAYIGYDFKKPVIINRIIMASRKDATYYYVSARYFDIEGWDENKWIVIKSGCDIGEWKGSDEEREYIFVNNTAYTKYRLNNIKAQGGAYGVSVPKLEMQSLQIELKEHWSTENSIKEYGMDSLSPLLDRRVETLEPLKMEDKTSILLGSESEGKVFSKTLDLKKYIDIISMRVEVK